MPKAPSTKNVEALDSALRDKRQRQAFEVLALMAMLALAWVAKPVVAGALLGALLAFVLQPSFNWLGRHGIGPLLAATLCTVGGLIVIGASIFGIGVILVSRGLAVVEALPASIQPDGLLHPLALRIAALMAKLHVAPTDALAQLRSGIGALALRGAGLAEGVTGTVGFSLVTLLFLGLSAFYVLLHWPAIVKRAEHDLPFNPAHTRALFGQFHNVGRQALFGTVSTGLIQGVLAGLGCWMTGVPEPTLWGALTAVLSLVPGIGTALVWLSVGFFQILTGHVTSGVVELIYGAVVVGLAVDYVVRPRLVGQTHVPALFTFVGLFGGVVVFGLIGLIVGPVLVSLCLAILDIYHREVAPLVAEKG